MPMSCGARRFGLLSTTRSSPIPTLKLAEFDYEERTIDGSIELFQKYELYVDTILNASEEILDVSPTKEWDAAVRIQLKPHRDYLLSPYFQNSGYLEQYTPISRCSSTKRWPNLLQASASAAERRQDRRTEQEGKKRA